jgi:hypothetical protein
MRIIFFAIAVLFLAKTSARAEMPLFVLPSPEVARADADAPERFGEGILLPTPPGLAAADSTELAGVPAWFWTYVPDVVWDDWREIIA